MYRSIDQDIQENSGCRTSRVKTLPPFLLVVAILAINRLFGNVTISSVYVVCLWYQEESFSILCWNFTDDSGASNYNKSLLIQVTNLRLKGDKSLHYDVIKWKLFPLYWPYVRGIHRSPVNSPHKGQWRGSLMFSLICALNKRLSKKSWG